MALATAGQLDLRAESLAGAAQHPAGPAPTATETACHLFLFPGGFHLPIPKVSKWPMEGESQQQPGPEPSGKAKVDFSPNSPARTYTSSLRLALLGLGGCLSNLRLLSPHSSAESRCPEHRLAKSSLQLRWHACQCPSERTERWFCVTGPWFPVPEL